MTDKQTAPQQAGDLVEVENFAPQPSLLDSIISQSRVARSDTERNRTRDLIGELVNQVLEGEMTPSKDLIAVLDSRIAEIDAMLSEQMNEIMHASEFQQLEASARPEVPGRPDRDQHYAEDPPAQCLEERLVRDLKAASEFDQSALFKKVYEEEYGTFGGAPFGMLIGDYEFNRNPEDMYLLEEISHVAAAAHAPFISAASPELFGWDSFTEMSGPRDWQRSSTPWNTPSGSRSAPRKTRATSALPCRTCSVACRMARTPPRWKNSTSSKASMAVTTTSTCG